MTLVKLRGRRKIRLGEDNNALVWLIIINAIFFTSLYLIRLIYIMSYDKELTALQFFHLQVMDWFAMPANAFKFITRPWVLFTYMFSQEDIMLLIGNLLWLWGFGYILQVLSGNSKLVPVYLYGGVSGGLFFLLAANILPSFSNNVINEAPLLGAGVAVMAVAAATTTLSPQYKIFPMINGGIPVWVLMLAYVLVDYASIGGYNSPVAIAHLAAALMGFVFTKQLQNGNDLGKWMWDLLKWVDALFNPEKKKLHPKQQLFYKANREPFQKQVRVTQKRLDEILDKINTEGYYSLSEEEKEFLKKASSEDF